jgi:hypothetical protein
VINRREITAKKIDEEKNLSKRKKLDV